MHIHRSLSLLPLTVFAIVLTSLAHADFQTGLDAYGQDDYATARQEWQLLAAQGDAKAQYNLGILYDNGQGVPQDYTQARDWWLKAAAQGHADAQYNLGVLYNKGLGVPQDYVQAHMWVNLAAAQGKIKDAATFRDTIAAAMPPEQIAEAQRLAREWLAQHQK